MLKHTTPRGGAVVIVNSAACATVLDAHSGPEDAVYGKRAHTPRHYT